MLQLSIHKKLNMACGVRSLHIETTIKKGEFVILFGQSGAGKTSLLKMIAGLMIPDSGTITANNEPWLDSANHINRPVQKRNIGLVFQDLALFPHMTVQENIQYAAKGSPNAPSVTQLLKMVSLENLRDRKPDALSGGQRQRVALARSLARAPEWLLLDEPFSALDQQMHHQLRAELFTIHKKLGLTTILVTHNLADVYHLADKVIVIEQGTIARSGTPNEVFGGQRSVQRLQIQGEIIEIKRSGVVDIAVILTGNTLTALVISEQEKQRLHPGTQVLITSGAFDPVLHILQ